MHFTDDNRIQLANEGYTVVKGVVSQGEVDSAKNTIFEYVKRLPKFPYCFGKKGIIQYYKSLIHSQCVWDMRQHSNIADVFAKIWNCNKEDLLVSFDGINIQKPPITRRDYAHPLGLDFHHIDQGSKKKGLQAVQGYISIEDSDEGDGCLVVRKRSHLFHDEFHDTFPGFCKDWVKLNDDHKHWYSTNDVTTIRVPSKKGDLVLWDSRCVHANSTAQPGRTNPERYRVVFYICMTPKSKASKNTLQKRIKYFEEGRITSHWPHIVTVFPKRPYLYGNKDYDESFEKDEELYVRPKLTELGRSLVGYSA